MSLGGLVLVKTSSFWWSLAGPVPCRRAGRGHLRPPPPQVAGRTPVGAALGCPGARGPAGGRPHIGGRAARDRRPQAVCGTSPSSPWPPAGTSPRPAPRRHQRARPVHARCPSAARPAAVRPQLPQLLSSASAVGRSPGPGRPPRRKGAELMRVPIRHIAGHLLWSADGHTWALYRLHPGADEPGHSTEAESPAPICRPRCARGAAAAHHPVGALAVGRAAPVGGVCPD